MCVLFLYKLAGIKFQIGVVSFGCCELSELAAVRAAAGAAGGRKMRSISVLAAAGLLLIISKWRVTFFRCLR